MPKRREPAEPRACVYCGKTFRPWKVDGRYCTKLCSAQEKADVRMSIPILVPRPDSHDVAWAAGFVDGEGCLTPTRSSSYESSEGVKHRRYLRLDVSQKNKDLLVKLRDIFGVGSIQYTKPRPGSSECHRWVCNGRAAFHVANLLWPYLGEQKKADFKRCLRAVRETRTDMIVQSRRGRTIVFEGSDYGGALQT